MDEKEKLDYSKNPVITADDYEEEEMWEEDRCKTADAHRHFVDEFDRNSPFYHGGDETPVPFDDLKIPNTMPSIYVDEDKRLKELYEQKMSLSNESIDLLELESQALHHLKKNLTAVSDAVTFRLTQMAGKTTGFLTTKIKAIIADCSETVSKGKTIIPDDLFSSSGKLLTEVEKSKSPTEAKDCKRKLEKLVREIHIRQNEVIKRVKEIKQALVPDLKQEFDLIVKHKKTEADHPQFDCPEQPMKEAEDVAVLSTPLTHNN